MSILRVWVGAIVLDGLALHKSAGSDNRSRLTFDKLAVLHPFALSLSKGPHLPCNADHAMPSDYWRRHCRAVSCRSVALIERQGDLSRWFDTLTTNEMTWLNCGP
ncbi:MAG: hypothetical protein CL694_09965 [Chloroflexi bacterium]|nr:hypothetical protein [Chloroflexota bacterium]HAL46482.1 hypothetical protein [Dehalococcoidia bacterium]